MPITVSPVAAIGSGTMRAARPRCTTPACLVAALLAALVPAVAAAVDGFFDPTWFGNGRRTIAMSVAPGSDQPVDMALRADGRTVIGGNCRRNEQTFPCVAQLLREGGLDPDFGASGAGVTVLSAFPEVPRAFLRAVAVDRDGTLVAFISKEVNDSPYLVRLSADGTTLLALQHFPLVPDQTREFDFPAELAIQPDRRVVVAAGVKRLSAGGLTDIVVTRAHADFTPDAGFGDGGARIVVMTRAGNDAGSQAYELALQPDGRIVIAAFLQQPLGGPTGVGLVRLTAAGALDASFGDNGRVVETSCLGGTLLPEVALALVPEGRIAWAARVMDTAANQDFCLNRRLADGTQDPDFGWDIGMPAGPLLVFFDDAVTSSIDVPSALVALEDGRLIVGGTAYMGGHAWFASARLRAAPRASQPLDTSYASSGRSYGKFDDSAPTAIGTAFVLGNGGLMVSGMSVGTSSIPTFGAGKLQHPAPLLIDGFEDF